MEGLNELSKEIHRRNIEKGFYEDKKNIGEMLALVHSEVSEALECDRKSTYSKERIKATLGWNHDEDFNVFFANNIKDTFEDELADIIIRVLDLAAFKGIDIESHIKAKMRFNSMRPHKHGKKY